jgi:hypothetical protein
MAHPQEPNHEGVDGSLRGHQAQAELFLERGKDRDARAGGRSRTARIRRQMATVPVTLGNCAP